MGDIYLETINMKLYCLFFFLPLILGKPEAGALESGVDRAYRYELAPPNSQEPIKCGKNTGCVFPFKFLGVTFNGCITMGNGDWWDGYTYWCATEYDFHEHSSNWGYCDITSCRREGHEDDSVIDY